MDIWEGPEGIRLIEVSHDCIRRMNQGNKLNWKVRSFLAAPILHHESRPLKRRCFGCSLSLLNLFFSAKDVCTINLTVSFYLYFIWNRVRSVSFSDGGLRDLDIIFRYENDLVLCFLGCVVKLPAREANSWRRKVSSNRGNWVFVVCFLSYRIIIFSRSNAHPHTNKEDAKTRGKAERRQKAVRVTRFQDYRLMFDSGCSFSLKYDLIRS